MNPNEQLFTELQRIDKFPMTDEHGVSYFYRGIKATRNNEKVVVRDITDSDGKYRIMREGEVCNFIQKHFTCK